MEMYIHKEDGFIIRKVSDFEAITKDWNNDNDIYTLTVAYFTEGLNRNFTLTEDELNDNYRIINNMVLYDKMRQTKIVVSPEYIKTFTKNYPNGEILKGYLYRLEKNDGTIYYTDEIRECSIYEWLQKKA